MLSLPVFLSAHLFYSLLSHNFRQSEHSQMPSASTKPVINSFGYFKLPYLPASQKVTETNGYSGEISIKFDHFLGEAIDENISLESWKLIF